MLSGGSGRSSDLVPPNFDGRAHHPPYGEVRRAGILLVVSAFAAELGLELDDAKGVVDDCSVQSSIRVSHRATAEFCRERSSASK